MIMLITHIMKKDQKNVRCSGQDYLPPKAGIVPVEGEDMICQSPLPGGNEGIGFENWN